jgi:hypothetical protein
MRAKKQTPPIIKALTSTAVSIVTGSIVPPLALLCILTARVQGSTKAEAASKQGWPLSLPLRGYLMSLHFLSYDASPAPQ